MVQFFEKAIPVKGVNKMLGVANGKKENVRVRFLVIRVIKYNTRFGIFFISIFFFAFKQEEELSSPVKEDASRIKDSGCRMAKSWICRG